MADLVEARLAQERAGSQQQRLQQTRPKTTTIPTLSLKHFNKGDPHADQTAAHTWDHACKHVGFLKVTDHGVPNQTIQAAWDASTHFFQQPLSHKRAAPMTDTYPYGYQGIGGENLQSSLDRAADANPGDIKEMFNCCLGGPRADPTLPAPVWPPDSTPMQQAYADYYRALERLAATLYRVCALALSLPADWFEQYTDSHRNVIRAIYYPEQLVTPQPGQVRASTHTDYGSLTLLRLGGSHSGGLQAMDRTGAWISVDVAPGEDAFCVNLGDLMARWTNDRWLSTPHRVINPEGDDAKGARQSIAYFCNINMDASVECIPSCRGADGSSRYGVITAGEHLMRKHQATVEGKLCYEADPDSEADA